MKKTGSAAKNAEQFLEYINTTYARLHNAYESAFWTSYMGDHSVDKKMNEAEKARNQFRSDVKLAAQVEEFLKIAKKTKNAENKNLEARLLAWKKSFSLYQMPPAAVSVKNKVIELEAKMMKDRSARKEGYIDPKTGKFVEASENKIRALMRTHPDETIRKAAFDALEKLGRDCLDDYVQLIGLRNECAREMGYEDFYAYKARTDEDMTKAELFGIFEKIYDQTKYAFKDVRDLEKKMQKEQKEKDASAAAPELRKPWNFGYMLSGDFAKEEDKFFQFEDALGYWGRSFSALGIDFAGGTLKLDLLDRKGKWNNGFCHYPDVVQYKKDAKNPRGKPIRIPGSAGFTCNAIPGQVGSGAQGLNTLFHEGGHAADRLNSMQTEVCLNHEYPPSTVSWAETQSMFMDTIAGSIEWRVRYAKAKDGTPYPFDLFERKVRKMHALRPLEMMHICFVVFFERDIYECKNLTKEKVINIAKKVYKQCFDRSEDSTYVLNVPHIYSWESSAYYHGYGLAELGVCQWRAYFFKKYGYIVDNPKVGKEIMKMWSYGSLYSAKQLIKMATGKFLSPDDFIRGVTKPLDEVIANAKARVARMEKVPMISLAKKPVVFNAKISMVHGKKKIADNSKGFAAMEKKYRMWYASLHDNL